LGKLHYSKSFTMLKITIFHTLLLVQLSSQFWFHKKAKPVKEQFLSEISVKLPGIIVRSENLPITEREAKHHGWRKADHCKCDGSKLFRGKRYRYKDENGTMLLFDSSGRLAGMQAAVPTSVEMAEQRKYMMPVDDGRYHLTIYFKDPKKICNVPAGRDRNNEKRFLIQTGPNWKSIMDVPINENELESTLWVKGSFVLVMGQFYWYNTSKEMDCEQVFPIYLTYSKGILYSFGWTFKGYFEDPRFDHPSPTLAAMAFNGDTYPDCIKNAKKTGSTQHVFLRKIEWLFG